MPEPAGPRPLLLLIAALVLVLLAHSPAAGGGFIWDDHHVVLSSQAVVKPRGASDFLDTAFFVNEETEPGGRGYYRPVTVLSWSIDHAIHGQNASGYHLTNLFLHVLNTGFLFALIRRSGASALAAAIGATVWGVLPRLTEAVSWISGRTDVLAASFALGALVVTTTKASWPRRIVASVLLLCGVLSKEVALAGLAGVMLLEWRRNATLKARALALLPSIATLLVYGFLRVHAIGLIPHGSPLPTSRRLSAAFEAVGHYLLSLLNPWQPNNQIGRLLFTSWLHVGLGIAVVIALVVVVPRLLRRGVDDLQLVGLIVTAAGFGLVLHLAPLAVNIVAADRFMYLPLAGLSLGATRSLASLLSRGRALFAAVALAVVTGSLGVATWLRASDWTDEITFWSNAYRQGREGNGVASVELGNIFFRAGLHLHAIGVYQSYEDIDEFNRAMSANNMATSLQAIGRYKAAHRVLKQIVQWFPYIPKFRVNLAFSSLSIDDFAGARHELDETLRLYPGHELAQSVKKDLPRLEKAGKIDYGESAQGLLARAKYSVETGRNYDAFQFMEQALSRENLPRAQADGALYFALKFADPAITARIFEGYVRSAGGRAPEAVIEAHRARVESGRRLLELWPSLGLPLPKFGK